jgi:hypothetical protein
MNWQREKLWRRFYDDNQGNQWDGSCGLFNEIKGENAMNKKIAPIIVVGILTLYLLGYLTMILTGMMIDMPEGIKVVLGVIAVIIVIVIAALIYTLIIRLKEIDKEDDDDLSKY